MRWLVKLKIENELLLLLNNVNIFKSETIERKELMFYIRQLVKPNNYKYMFFITRLRIIMISQ